jgi:competence protein ComFA
MKFVSFLINGKKYIRPTSRGDKNGMPISLILDWGDYPLNRTFKAEQKLHDLLIGRRLLIEQVTFPLTTIQKHVENGYVCYEKGLSCHEDRIICNRCGNEKKESFGEHYCSRCLRQCKYCRKCIMMGKISQCTPLVRWCGPKMKELISKDQLMKWEGELSLGQARASTEVVKAIQGKESLLVWAVCGAGKTEVLFKGIEEALKSNKNVCVASPRVDVIHELTPRFKKVFPSATIISLFGGSKERQKVSNFVLATTHQLLNFFNYFDVIVIDEVDAFPYSYDKTLSFGVKNAKKQNASTILLSATPSRKLVKEFPTIKIPARFHRNPLPLPNFKWIGDWSKKLKSGSLPTKVLKWVEYRINNNIPALLFVNTVETMEKVTEILLLVDNRISSVHSEDKQRKDKVDQFRDGKIPLLVTTTILERGITIRALDVAVFAAEEELFTKSALIQIAGRVGRSVDYPSGNITFFHFGKTRAMIEAKKELLRMNKEAESLGYLDGE